LVLQALVNADTQTVVPPLKTEPMTVGPMATPIAPTEGPTNDRAAGWKAGRVGRAGRAPRAGNAGTAALAPATGPAIASAVMTPAAEAAPRLIQLVRLFIAIVSSLRP
jgi:hypothetical protein